jgi:hypothetical protein
MVTCFLGLAGGVPMGEWELHLACVRCGCVVEKSGRKGVTTASWDGRVPLASDRATEERYMGTCLVCLCIVERCSLQGYLCTVNVLKKSRG